MTAQSTKVVTDKVRFSYVNIFRSRAFQEGQTAKYSICLLIPKEDKATVKKIRAAIEAAIQDGISSKWGGKKPGNLKLPLRDGDEERADEAPEYEGMYFLNANSTQKPGIVDKDLNEILDPDEVYSGCWGRASINFYAFEEHPEDLVPIDTAKIREELGFQPQTAEEKDRVRAFYRKVMLANTNLKIRQYNQILRPALIAWKHSGQKR